MNRRNFSKITATSSLGILPFLTNANSSIPDEFWKQKKPKRLKKGDTIGLITPGSFISDEGLNTAVEHVESLGFKVQLGKNIRAKRGFNAGTDVQRLEDLHGMFSDRNINGVWCARGGYGCGRILQGIDYQLIKRNTKALIGYSDITALLLAIYKKTEMIGFHGPVAASDFTDYTVAHFQKIVMEPQADFLIKPAIENLKNEDSIYHSKTIVSGKARGKLIGGNLSLLASLAGTDFAPDFKNKIVFIEDIGEKPYRIDRMLTQLRQGTNLKAAKGIALGIFADCEAPAASNSLTLLETLTDRLGDLKIPVVYGLSFGHIANQMTLPIGVEAELNADDFMLKILETAVE
ncbi:MAG: muramoyltetrapeptide carboxypeptidase [Paraglaciecola sp.]|jgi:muramoyltetrapeptide carboxypeptidase